MAMYCSTQCQASHWASSHKAACQELKETRKCTNALDKAEGRPLRNRHFIGDWFRQIPGLNFNVALLAWKHRSTEECPYILVQTFKHVSSSGAPAGTPHLTALTRDQWKQLIGGGESEMEIYETDVESSYIVCFDLENPGSETWPRRMSLCMQHSMTADRMDFEVHLKECTDAKSFPEKIVAEAAFQELKLAHPLLVSSLVKIPTHFGHRLSAGGVIGCVRGLRGASHLNDTIGLFISKDPNNPKRSAVELADGQVRSVSDTNFDLLRIGTGRVDLHGLTGAAHLNGKRGTLLRVKPGSLERVVIRMDVSGEEMAVKFANFKRCVEDAQT